MAIFEIEYHSDTLGQVRPVSVIYPDKKNFLADEETSDLPVLYLLHGMGDNHRTWRSRTHIERLVNNTNLVVVMPSTELGWYTNTEYGINYYDAIANELPLVIKHFFPNISTKREKNFIAGLSMGGYGSFKLAFLTNRFSHAASFSGALGLGQDLIDNTGKPLSYWRGIFGRDEVFLNGNDSLLAFAKKSDKKTNLYAWCGKEDFLYDSHEKIIEKLQSMDFKLVAQSDHGTHNWYYWEKQLEIFLEQLPIKYVKEERLS